MGNEQHSIATYVSDMLALERHIREPFLTQSKDDDVPNFPGAQTLVQRLCDISQRHIDELKSELDRQGGHEASPLKSAVSEIAGAAASAIDKMRKTKISKSLRDDYTALALCTAGYSALLATANAMATPSVAQLAERFLRDYAAAVMDIGQLLPAVVVQELRDTDLQVDESTIGQTKAAVSEAWRSGGDNYATRGTISGSSSTAATLGRDAAP